MAAVACGRLGAPPDIWRGQLLEELRSPDGDERQAANRGRWITGRADEPRVVVLRDRKSADEKLADVDPVYRTLILFSIRCAHQEIASGNSSEIGRCCGQSRQYSPGLKGHFHAAIPGSGGYTSVFRTLIVTTPKNTQRVHDCRGIVTPDRAVADDRHGHHSETERNQLVVRAIVILDVFDRERRVLS